MLIVSRNTFGNYAVLPLINDIEIIKNETFSINKNITGNNVNSLSHSFQDDLNLVYLIENDTKETLKKELIHIYLYLFSGVVLKINNLDECNYDRVETEIVNLKIKLNQGHLNKRLLFKNLAIQNIFVYKVNEDTEYDFLNDKFYKIKNTTEKKNTKKSSEVSF